MKAIIKISALITGTILLLSVSCKKMDFHAPVDPFANLSNQLVCKIDGAEWKSNQKGGGFYQITGSGQRFIYLAFANGHQEINFWFNPPYNPQYYILNTVTGYYPYNLYPADYALFSQSYPTITPPEENYVTNNIDTGRVDFVQFDSVNHIIKAKFSFTGKDNRTGLKKIINEGYFEYHQS